MTLLILIIIIFGYIGYKIYEAVEDNTAYHPPEGYEIDWVAMSCEENKTNRQIDRDMKKGMYLKKKTDYK